MGNCYINGPFQATLMGYFHYIISQITPQLFGKCSAAYYLSAVCVWFCGSNQLKLVGTNGLSVVVIWAGPSVKLNGPSG